MLPIISLVSIFGYSLFLYLKLNIKISISIFFSISLIILLIFISGILDLLKIGTYLVFYIGIITFFYQFVKNKNKAMIFITSVPLILFVLISSIYLFLSKDYQFFFYDEYSHWGVFIKEVFLSHKFYDINSIAIHLRYPPGITVWDYFILLPYHAYNEGSIYFAYFLILFSSVLMMYENLKWNQFPLIVLIFTAQILIFATYGHWFNSIYVDHIIGALFAGMLLSYLISEYKDKQLLLFIFPVISIVLIKEIGLFFSLSFVGFIYIHTFYKMYFNNSLYETFIKTKKTFFICLVIFISAYLTLSIWNIRQDSFNVPKEHQTISGITKALYNGEASLKNEDKALISNRFWRVVGEQALHKDKISLNYNEFSYGMLDTHKKTLKLSTFGSFIFFLVFIEIIRFTLKNEQEKKLVSLTSSYLILVSSLYLIILYFSFLVAFGDRAILIPSYVRYMNISVLPLYMILIYFFLPIFSKKIKDIKGFNLQIPSFILFLVAFIFITSPYIKPFYSNFKSSYREYFNEHIPTISPYIDSKTKLAVVLPIKKGATKSDVSQFKLTLKYLLIPIKTKIIESNFFDKRSSDEILKEFINYDYVWILSTNYGLINILKNKTSEEMYTLYKINKVKEEINLIPVN